MVARASVYGMTAIPVPSAQKSRGTVLVVDDHASIREAMTYALEAFGYEVVTAADGDEALDQLRRGTLPSLIVLDLEMPRKDGWAFRSEQTRDPKLAAIPTIVSSADISPMDKAAAPGIAGYFSKGDSIDEMLDMVERHCLGN
jgi:two-component system response regulator MprA